MIGKRLRFEIFRRDNHACQYCGATAPAAELTVDHIVPVALGGSDDPANLVTACADCNAGKAAGAPSADRVEAASAAAMRWAGAIREAAELQRAERQAIAGVCTWFLAAWEAWWCGPTKDPVPLPGTWAASIEHMLCAGAEADDLEHAVDRAMRRDTVDPDQVWRYFCGVVWSVLRERHQLALGLLADREPEQPPGRSAATPADVARIASEARAKIRAVRRTAAYAAGEGASDGP